MIGGVILISQETVTILQLLSRPCSCTTVGIEWYYMCSGIVAHGISIVCRVGESCDEFDA